MKIISIVVPMYNESDAVDDFFNEINKHTAQITADKPHLGFEIVAVNDGSTDETLQKLMQWQEQRDNVAVVSLSRNFGQEPAIFAGLEKAGGDAVIVMDCDLQDPPETIARLAEKWEEGYDIVNVRRSSRATDTRFKSNTAGMYYRILNKLSYKVKYPHNVNNFRLVSRKVLNTILSMPEKNKFYRGLVPYVGFKHTEIDVARCKRSKGESKYNLKAMVKLASDGVASTSTKPLTWAFCFGMMLLVLSLLGAAALIALSLSGAAANYTLFGVLAGIAFFTGILLLFLGIIGFYLAKAFEEIKGRPFAIIERYIPPKRKLN